MANYSGSDKRLQYLFEHGGGGGGGNANIWTGTQAEYEAQASQIADDTVVLITDDEEQAQAVQVYSTEEQIYGTWIDGSTIYKKTFVLQSALNIASYTWTSLGISSSGINMVIDGEFIRIDTKGKIALSYNVDTTAGFIKVMNLSDYSLACSAGSIVTLFYTKTT